MPFGIRLSILLLIAALVLLIGLAAYCFGQHDDAPGPPEVGGSSSGIIDGAAPIVGERIHHA
jgi:hypothetical protein